MNVIKRVLVIQDSHPVGSLEQSFIISFHNDPYTHLSDNGVERKGAVTAKNLNKHPDPDKI